MTPPQEYDQNVEPRVPQFNSLWAEGCEAWIERYEYIVQRTEEWLANFEHNPAYDFTQEGGVVKRQQTALEISYCKYAEGSLTLGGVADQAKMLREAYKIPVPVVQEPYVDRSPSV